MFGWFNSADVDRFADGAASGLVAAFPKSEVLDPKRKSSTRFQKARSELLKTTHAFATTSSINFYQKARLGNRFKWNLIEAGYPVEFADELTLEVLKVASAPRADSAARDF